PRLAAADQAQEHLHRRAGPGDRSPDRPGPHFIFADRRRHRAPRIDRSQSAEHPDPHRGRPQDPPRLHCRAGPSADYSQIELRLAAEMADVTPLKDAFRAGADIHALTASEVFGVPMPEMTGEIRRRAKAINFGIIYGMSA